MTGETRDPHDWVETGRFVRAFCAADRSTHSYGWVKSYCDAPTVGIERPDGTWLNWRADLCEPADPSTEQVREIQPDESWKCSTCRSICDPTWKRCPYCTSSGSEHLAYLLGQYNRLLAVHEHVVMDTPEDQARHQQVVETFRAAGEALRVPAADQPGGAE